MKITQIKTYVVGNPWKNWIFIKLYTDEGVTGVGEATGGLQTKPIEAAVQKLSSLVIGKDPTKINLLWDDLYKALFLGYSVAMSGIEQACWDILGKTLQVPVYQLLGGAVRKKIRAYANGWYKGPRDSRIFRRGSSQDCGDGIYGA